MTAKTTGLTPAQLAKRLGCTRGAVLRMLAHGCPYVGGRPNASFLHAYDLRGVRFDIAEVQAWLDAEPSRLDNARLDAFPPWERRVWEERGYAS